MRSAKKGSGSHAGLVRPSIRLGLVIMISVCSWTSITRAQTLTSSVSYAGAAQVTTLGPQAPAVDGHSAQRSSQSLASGVFLQRDFFATQTDSNTGTATGLSIFNVFAYAQPGTLRVNALGVASAKTTVPYNFAGTSAQAGFSNLSASWADTAALSVPIAEPGRSFTLNVSLLLDGSLEVDLRKGGGWSTGVGELFLSLSGRGMPPGPYGGFWGLVYRDLSNPAGDQTQLPPAVIPLAIPMPNGEFVGLNYTMLVSGRILVSSQAGFFAPGFGTTDGSIWADLGQSLTWGGIDSVTDTETGLPVTGWSITSASGFDYSQPAPEPAAGLMLGVGALALAAIGRRRVTSSPEEPGGLPIELESRPSPGPAAARGPRRNGALSQIRDSW